MLAIRAQERRRARHRHRRRDPPGELLQPLRDRARRRRHRQPRAGPRPQRPPQPGAAGRRPDPPARPDPATATWSSCARTPTGTIKVTVPGPFTMSQQAQDDHYGDPRSVALAYAEAVQRGGAGPVRRRRRHRAARRALHAGAARAGPRVRPRGAQPGARRRGRHDRRAHLLRLRRDHPRAASGYSFLPELADCPCDQVSIETAQSGLDPSVLKHLPGKTIMLGVLDLSDHAVETPEVVAERVRRGARRTSTPSRLVLAPDCGMKYLPRASAEGKMRSMVERRADAARRGGLDPPPVLARPSARVARPSARVARPSARDTPRRSACQANRRSRIRHPDRRLPSMRTALIASRIRTGAVPIGFSIRQGGGRADRAAVSAVPLRTPRRAPR